MNADVAKKWVRNALIREVRERNPHAEPLTEHEEIIRKLETGEIVIIDFSQMPDPEFGPVVDIESDRIEHRDMEAASVNAGILYALAEREKNPDQKKFLLQGARALNLLGRKLYRLSLKEKGE